jgi:hypothetical protein
MSLARRTYATEAEASFALLAKLGLCELRHLASGIRTAPLAYVPRLHPARTVPVPQGATCDRDRPAGEKYTGLTQRSSPTAVLFP